MKGQALFETLLAVLFLTAIFFGLFSLSRRLAAQTLLDYAAARAARARAVGLNKFMCRKSARVATIPVAGQIIHPASIGDADEVARAAVYMVAGDESIAAGVLDYAGWHKMEQDYGDKGDEIHAKVSLPYGEGNITGEAKIESHWPYYMEDGGQ